MAQKDLPLWSRVLELHLRMAWEGFVRFGPNPAVLRQAVVRPLWILFNHAMIALDRLGDPQWASLAVREPVFITGHPRSGTTLVHRVLGSTGMFVTSNLAQLLLPSLSAQKLRVGLQNLAARLGSSVFPDSRDGHEMHGDEAEEEEIVLYNVAGSIHLLSTTPLGFAEEAIPWVYDEQAQSPSLRREHMSFLKEFFQRRLYVEKKEKILAKMPMLVFRLQSVLETFPDCRVVYMVRAPHETIPSLLSLQRRVLKKSFGSAALNDENQRNYIARQYERSRELYGRMEKFLNAGAVAPQRILVVRYPEIKTDLLGLMTKIIQFCGLTLEGDGGRALEARVEWEKRYVPMHRNRTLQDFGLSPHRVYEDLKDIYEKYDFPPPPVPRQRLGEERGNFFLRRSL